MAEPIRPAGTPVDRSAWAAPAASEETPSGGSSTSDERFKARSRLDQAMTVAQKRIEAGKQIVTTRRPDSSSEWAAAREEAKEEKAPVDDTPHVVVDLRPDADRIPGPMPAVREADYGLGRRWGAEWQRSAQGWVTAADGRATWRPVVTTTQ